MKKAIKNIYFITSIIVILFFYLSSTHRSGNRNHYNLFKIREGDKLDYVVSIMGEPETEEIEYYKGKRELEYRYEPAFMASDDIRIWFNQDSIVTYTSSGTEN